MKAPRADQLKLLELQTVDSQLSRLQAAKRKAKVLEDISATTNQAKEVNAQGVALKSELSAARRDLSLVETEVEQTTSRLNAQQQRLDSGTASARELSAIQQEIGSLKKRLSDLEDRQLEEMSRFEEIESKLEAAKAKVAELKTAYDALMTQKEEEFAQIDSEIDQLTQQRSQLADAIDADLLAEYDHIREETGGLAVVGLHGIRAEGLEMDFSVAQEHQIRSAAEDDVIISEDHGYILVCLED